MEVGQTTASSSQHYPRRWEVDRDSIYPDNLEGRKLSGGVSWSHDQGQSTSSSSTPSSLSSILPIVGSDGSVDKVLYQNLVEMIPLVETLMDQQNSKSFPRHASLIYTPTPSRDALPLRKIAETSVKGKKGNGQLPFGKKKELKDSLFWDNAENLFHTRRETYSEQIPMLSVSTTDLQADQAAINKAKVVHLQSQIEQLERKIAEKDSQLEAENSSQQAELLRLQVSIDELQRQIVRKERDIQKAHGELSDKQYEVAGLHSLLEKAESVAKESNIKVLEVQEELDSLQCQLVALLMHMQSILSRFYHEDQMDGFGSSAAANAVETGVQDEAAHFDLYQLEAEEVELTRRKYLAALIAAKRHPSEELLTLAAELRGQLQACVLHFGELAVENDLCDVQSSRSFLHRNS